MITDSNCSMLILFLSKSTVFANKLEWYHDNNILNTCPWLGQSWSIPGQKYFPLSPFASPSPYRQPPSRVWLKFLSTKQHTLYNVHAFDYHEHCMDEKRQWDYQFLNNYLFDGNETLNLDHLVTAPSTLFPRDVAFPMMFFSTLLFPIDRSRDCSLICTKGFLKGLSFSTEVYLIITSSYFSM